MAYMYTGACGYPTNVYTQGRADRHANGHSRTMQASEERHRRTDADIGAQTHAEEHTARMNTYKHGHTRTYAYTRKNPPLTRFWCDGSL
eukprot:56340-Eustigmatos_ZCMA.PRE.1